MSKQTMRKIHIDGEEWHYFVGKQNVVVITPSGRKTYIPCHEIKFCTPDVFDRGKWKGTSDGMITPFDMKWYLRQGVVCN
jgi:hypothetical protein